MYKKCPEYKIASKLDICKTVKRVRAKFSKNCAFCDTSIISTVRFHLTIRTNIRYGTISEMDVVEQENFERISYVLLLKFYYC